MKKILNIISHWVNTNQNYNEAPFYTYKMAITIKEKTKCKWKITSHEKEVAEVEPHGLLMGMNEQW